MIDLVTASLAGPATPPNLWRLSVHNMEPPPGALADFGFNAFGHPVHIRAMLDPVDYSVKTQVVAADEGLGLHYQNLHLWGVPGDPAHDRARGIPYPVDRWGVSLSGPHKPFLTLPSECGVADTTDLTGLESWQERGVFAESASSVPAEVTGCDRLRFEPSMSIDPTSTVADAPTGLDVRLALPQDENPNGLGTPPLKRATVTLPEGMSINPAAADGLGACSDDQLRLGTNLGLNAGEPACPEASKVGSVVVKSPALEDPVEGGVFIRSQNSSDPASGEMFRMALVVKSEERGLIVKLPGSVKADPRTGRLEATFDDNPQLPVSEITLRLKGGDRAPLANPDSCGTKTTSIELSSWGGQTSSQTDSYTIPCPGGQGFSPAFDAGSVNPTGGEFSPFVARIDRAERDQYLSRIDIDMPKGLLAKLKGVALCPDAVAGDGTPGACPAGSRIGIATVGAGSGKAFHLQGPVYLTGPYKGAPYGLSVQVPAKAGPFDLGIVKVRNALHVDPVTAQVSVVSDPLPQIVKGVPVRLRSVDVNVDRPGFTINPTSCAEKQIAATLTSVQGAVHKTSSRFQVGDCQALAFKPKLAMRLTGRKQTRTGGHPSLRAVLTQRSGQANIKAAKVILPKSIALDANNSTDPKLLCDYDRALEADCPKSSIIGKATAVAPVLNKPLKGNVHLVQGITIGKKGNRIRTLPTLLVKLRGEVAIDLRARTNASNTTGRLETTFTTVPDAPVSKFTLNINGGRKGILTVTRTAKNRINLCAKPNSHTAQVETDAQNGKRADFSTRIKTPCKAKKAARKKGRGAVGR